MINIGIFDHQKLMLNGLERIISDVDDFQVVLTTYSSVRLHEKVKKYAINVMILSIHTPSVQNMNQIVQLNLTNPRVKLLVVSPDNSVDMILKIIKAKANGFLGRDATPKDLIEAIYTLRNGFDFFNESINQLLLNQYVSNLKSNIRSGNDEIKNLSERQIEILKLWGKSFTNQEIADQLFISVRTVESHKNHIMQKLNLKTTIDLVKFSIKNNLIDI